MFDCSENPKQQIKPFLRCISVLQMIQKITEMLSERRPWRSFSPNFQVMQERCQHEIRPTVTFLAEYWKSPRMDGYTASLGNFFQCCANFFVKKWMKSEVK